ncbi:MAG TPA: hypothetical protein VKB47_12685 [Terracidiphilus sp.]|nr:hypothetical protein [Terracidiphilus sp.]
MSDEKTQLPESGSNDEEPSSGFSLTLAYSLLAAAIIAAICIALFIVLPFYHRR